ncbi:MAG TPA: O-antigen ligase family protein [Candidatus Paceibacterota bacterium]|nr:O-antigen ligase family protein [Candidatus Paceibacterota bacterium]
MNPVRDKTSKMSADSQASRVSNGMKYLERAFPWILLAPVILPIVVWGGLIYPYLVPKTLLFYAISLIAAGVFAVLVAYGRTFFWGRLARPEAWVPAALLALAYLASALGIDFYRSLWSTFERGDGLLMLSGVVLSFYLILLSADRAFFERLLRAVAVVGTLVALYGIGEWLMGGGRIGSLLGNAALFAGYLGIAVFATLAAAESLRRAWRLLAYVGAALQVIAILFSATRGTILALIVALVAYLAYLAWRGEGKQRAWAAGTLIALGAFGGLFFAFRSELANVPFAPVARVASISVNDPDVASRLFIWKNMVTEIEKSPWLGVGAEHIDVLFNRFYDPTQISEQWFDRSHNAFLDYAAQYGIGGLLLYLALIASFFTAAARIARRGEKRLAGVMALLAIAYAVQNFFVFDTISSFWLLVALLAAFLATASDAHSRTAFVLPGWSRYAAPLLALVLAYLILPVSILPALAAHDLSQAYAYQIIDPARETALLSHGIALGTYADLEYGYQAYSMYTMQSTALSGQALVGAYQASLAILTTDFNRYPYDARTALYLAHVLTLAPAGVTVDQSLLSSALERAISLSPKRLQPWYILTNLSLGNANAYPSGSSGRVAGYAAARDLLSRYIALVPSLSEPHFVLAELEYAAGDTAAAAAEAATGKKTYVSDLETAKRAAGYYETVLDLPDAAFFLEEILRLDPMNTAAKNDLAKVRSYLSR